MLKKFLATALAAAMILGFAGIASAASFSDTEGHLREGAVSQLTGLGVLDGYDDGTFKPDNPITRAEFCKLVVVSLGLGEAANMLSGVPVGFSDVPSNHWATGHISIAASQGIVKGYPDGTFQPEANVTYAESVTMTLRALGYGPDLEKGTWPTTAITIGSKEKVTKGITFGIDNDATRGDVIQMLSNSLEKPIMEVSLVTGALVPSSNTLLGHLGGHRYAGVLHESPELWGFDKSEISISGLASPFELPAGVSVAGLLGHKVVVITNDDGLVLSVEDVTPETSIKTGAAGGPGTVQFGTAAAISVPATAYLFVNNLADSNPTTTDTAGHEITVIYDGPDIISVIAQTYGWGIVKSVNTTFKMVTLEDGTVPSLSLDGYTITWQGAAESLADLKKGDVVHVIDNGTLTKKHASIIVVRNSVSGLFSKISGTKYTVGGVAYEQVAGADPTLLAENVTILLNKDGKIVRMTEFDESASPSIIYGVLADYKKIDGSGWESADKYQLKLYGVDGKTSQPIDLAAKVTWYDTSIGKVAPTVAATVFGQLPAKGSLVSYGIDADGAIDTLTVECVYASPTGAQLTINKDLGLIKSSASVGKPDIKITADTVVFDVSTLSKPKVMTVATLLKNAYIEGAVAYTGATSKCILVTNAELATVPVDVHVAMVYDKYQGVHDGKSAYFIQVVTPEGVEDYRTTKDTYSTTGVAAKAIIEYTVSDGVLKTSADDSSSSDPVFAAKVDPGSTNEWRVVAVDTENGVVKVQKYTGTGYTTEVSSTEEYFVVNSKTLYYNQSKKASVSLLEVGTLTKVDIHQNATTGNLINVLVLKPE